MGKMNYILDRLYPKGSENDWGAIPKEKNTSKHKCNQTRWGVTSPITPTQRLGIGALILGDWIRGLRLQRSEDWHLLEPI